MKRTRRYGIYFMVSLIVMLVFLLALLFSPAFTRMLDPLLCPGEAQLERLVEQPTPDQSVTRFVCAGQGDSPDVRLAVLILVVAAFPIGLAFLTFASFLGELSATFHPAPKLQSRTPLADLAALVESMERGNSDEPLPMPIQTLQERLKRLQAARESGLITAAEYEARRQQVVEDYTRGT
ncbi:MAG: SHOCT domain-containing protein [Anaerolineae bacterium]